MILWYYLKVIVLENSSKAFSIGLSVNHYAQLFQPPKNPLPSGFALRAGQSTDCDKRTLTCLHYRGVVQNGFTVPKPPCSAAVHPPFHCPPPPGGPGVHHLLTVPEAWPLPWRRVAGIAEYITFQIGRFHLEIHI